MIWYATDANGDIIDVGVVDPDIWCPTVMVPPGTAVLHVDSVDSPLPAALHLKQYEEWIE